eukprot:1157806-Pelagomonas_calceolata.AAC.2
MNQNDTMLRLGLELLHDHATCAWKGEWQGLHVVGCRPDQEHGLSTCEHSSLRQCDFSGTLPAVSGCEEMGMFVACKRSCETNMCPSLSLYSRCAHISS